MSCLKILSCPGCKITLITLMYQRAIAASISDGFARHFASEFRAFKRVHRAERSSKIAGRVGRVDRRIIINNLRRAKTYLVVAKKLSE